MTDSNSDSNITQSPKSRSSRIHSDSPSRDDSLSPVDLREILERLTNEENESKEIKQSTVRKLTADMTDRGRKLGAHLESIHGYVVKECTNVEESMDQRLSDELADELRKRTTSVDTEIKQLENQMGQLQRTLVKGKARRESLRHRMSVTSPAGRKASAMSSCSSTSEAEELSLEDYKATIEMLENEKLEWLEDKKDLGDEIKFLKYQLQYRLEVQSLQNDNNVDSSELDKVVQENETLREENCSLKERLTTLRDKLKEKGNVEESLLSIADVSKESLSGVSSENELERLHNERKILLSTIMRMQSIEKDEDEASSFADFGVQVELNKLDTIEEDSEVTPLVAKLTEENKALKKHITDMQKDLDDYEEERKAMSEENFKLIDEKRSLEDTINKLRSQMSDTLDTTLDEIEQLHSFNEELEGKCKRTEAKFRELLQVMDDLKNKNCKLLESMLDEVENKVNIEEIFDFLDNEVTKIIDQNQISFRASEPKGIEQSTEEKQFSSNLLKEVQSCKDLLESQRSHIRKLQLDKRDIEEGYTKMKREVLLLKSSKQRAREKSKELQFLNKRRAKSLNDGAQEAKAVLVDKESLQREVRRLSSVKEQLENTVQKLKKEKASLEDDKVCLLGSLYHQLERNESLEMQIEELSAALAQLESKSDLDSDVFIDDKIEEGDLSPDKKSPDVMAIEKDADESQEVADESNEIQQIPSNDLNVEQVNGRPTSQEATAVGLTSSESTHEMKEKIHALGKQLQAVQDSVIELETERDSLLQELDESKKNEKELRNVIVQLKRENSIHEDKVMKSNELAETLQIRLQDAQTAKGEVMESLEEARAEKEVSKKHCEVLDNRLKEVTKQRDEYKSKAEKYNEYLKELYGCVTEMVQTDSADESSSKNTETDEDRLQSDDEIQSGIYNGLGAFQSSINEMMQELNTKNEKISALNGQIEASSTEKEALQKSVREAETKKKQLKGFISKLTEEKEKIMEQLDEMKQQKSNLADALENVYQSKEKLQNRLSESLCKQEQLKKLLAESIDEAKTLRESLYRMVNEHETMKESLLAANREVERLKSQHRLHTGIKPINVIKEEEEEDEEEEEEQREEGYDSEGQTDTDETATTYADTLCNADIHNLREITDRLKEAMCLFTDQNKLLEAEVRKLQANTPMNEEQDKTDSTKEEASIEHAGERSGVHSSTNGTKHRVDDEAKENEQYRNGDEGSVSEDVTKMKGEENSAKEDDKKENEEFVSKEEISNEEGDSRVEPNQIKTLFKCFSEMQSKDAETISFMKAQISELEKVIEEAHFTQQFPQDELDDNEAISGLVELQEDLLTKKLNHKQAEDNRQLVQWFEVISQEKEKLEKDLENASQDNIKLLEDLASLREENQKLTHQLEGIDKENGSSEAKVKETESSEKEDKKQPSKSVGLHEESDGHTDEKIPEGFQSLDKLDVLQLQVLTKKLLDENSLLNNKINDLTEASQHYSAIEQELGKSNDETIALEKQVQVLSKEGATLRSEADERVQKLIELEENMILTIEKKLELAEYASMLTSKKDTLERKCEQLSREVEGLKESRDQIMALKSISDEEMRSELTELKEFKERAVREIEDLNDILRIGRQDFEAIKIELDSMQKKNKSLKQELDKASAREEEITSNFQEKLSDALAHQSSSPDESSTVEMELLKIKILKLESDVVAVSEKLEQLQKERDDLVLFLTDLIDVYEAEAKNKENQTQDTGKSVSEMGSVVAEMKTWIKSTSDAVATYADKTNMLDSLVQEVEQTTSEVLDPASVTPNEEQPNYNDEDISKTSYESARLKLKLLINKLKESFQNQTNFETQLDQIKEDNQRITKELEEKSNFLNSMRDSFEQVLQERNLLAQNAKSNGQQAEEDVKTFDTQNVKSELKETVGCDDCKKLELERDDLKATIASANKEGAELREKCHLLKENILRLKAQQESIINNNIPITADSVNDKDERPDSFEEHLVEDVLFACESVPVSLFETDLLEKTSSIKPSTPEDVKTQSQRDDNKKEVLKDNEPLQETEELLQADSARDDLQCQLKKHEEEIKMLHDINNNLEKEVACLKEKIKEIKHLHDRETTELKKEFLQQEHELGELSKEKEQRKELIENLKTKIDKLKTSSSRKEYTPTTRKSTDDIEEDSAKLRKMLAERSSSVKDLNEKLGVSKSFMLKILDENRDLNEDVTNYQLEKKEMRKEIEVLKAEVDLKKTVLFELKDDKSQLEAKKNRLEEDLASVKEQLKIRGALLATLEKDKENFKGNLRKANQEVESLKKQHELLQELTESGKQRQKDTEALLKKLKQSCDEMTKDYEKVLAEKKKVEETLTDELHNERRKNEEYKDRIESLDKSQTSLEKTLTEYKEKVQNLTRELRRDKSRRDREIDSIRQENFKLLTGETRLQKELESLREQLEDERSKNDKLESDLKSAIIHNLTLNNSLKVQSDEKDKKSKELEGNKKESKRLNTLTGDLKSKIAHLEALLKSTKDEKKFMSEEIDKVKALNNDLRLRLNESGEDKEELEDILVEMREKRQKLHDEIDKALTERDELEDELIDLKKEMSKKIQTSLEEHKKAEVALEKALQREITLQHEMNQLKRTKSEALVENSVLKDELEKAKTDLISHLQSTLPSTSEESTTPESNVQLQKALSEAEKLSSLLENSQKEIEDLKAQLRRQENKCDREGNVDEQEPIQEEVITVVQTKVQFSSCVDGLETTLEGQQTPDSELSKCNAENTKLRAQLQEVESKALYLKDELDNIARKQVQDEFKNEAVKRRCKALEDDLQKSQNQLMKAKNSLHTSNSNVTDLQKRLRKAFVEKEKFESEYKRLLKEKGVVEKVKVKSIEVPAASQMVEFDKDIPVAKAESLESARKEIVIIEAQVKDMRERTKQDRELVEHILSEIDYELTRALKVLGIKPEKPSEENNEPDTTETTRSLLFNYHDLQNKLGALRKKTDRLEQGRLKPVDQNFIEALSKQDKPISEKLDVVIKENNKLNHELQLLQERLSGVLQEKHVLEDIGSSTRKELRSMVKSLSTEREQMKSLNTEHSKMKLKLDEAEKKIKELKETVSSLQNNEPVLAHHQIPEIEIQAEDVNVVQAIPLQEQHDLKAESKHLEMELMEQDREMQWLKHECKDLTAERDHLKHKCKRLQDELNSCEAANKKLDAQNQELYDEVRKKDRYLTSYREDNEKLLTIQKTSEAQIRHLNREIELFSDRVVCCEAEKEQIEQTNRRQHNEIQELVLHKTHDNVAREKLEKVFYENAKLKEQKKMLATRLQTLERDMKSQILTARDLEAEKEELLNKIDKIENEKRNEITKKERYAYLLDKHENDSRSKIDSLSRLVEKLKRDKDELCSKDPRLDKIHQENNKLTKECTSKDSVINKLQDENKSLTKENDALRRSYNKLKESQRMLQPPDVKDPQLERSNSLRLSPNKAGSKTSSFSSIDRASVASSRVSNAPERRDSRSRTPPRRSSRSSSARRSDKSTPEGDLTGGGSQECFCSPILSVVNLCPYEVQQGQGVDESGLCPVCKKRKNRKGGMIKEHYV